jgi:hypothetical protein
MNTSPKPYVKPLPVPKSALYEMLAQAVRNTAPELNPVAVPISEPVVKRRMRPHSYRVRKRPV